MKLFMNKILPCIALGILGLPIWVWFVKIWWAITVAIWQMQVFN